MLATLPPSLPFRHAVASAVWVAERRCRLAGFEIGRAHDLAEICLHLIVSQLAIGASDLSLLRPLLLYLWPGVEMQMTGFGSSVPVRIRPLPGPQEWNLMLPVVFLTAV